MSKTFHIMTFGCQMNVHDSKWLARSLEQRGFEEASIEEAQIVIINTCSVREKPELRVYAAIGRLKPLLKPKAGAFIVVAGCVAQQLGASLLERTPLVRLVVGTDAFVKAPALIERLVAEPKTRIALIDVVQDFPERDLALAQTRPDDATQVCVNIMQGCNNFCAYCIVPYTRGRQKSRSISVVLDECRALLASGAKDITLLGQNVNSFGLDQGFDQKFEQELGQGFDQKFEQAGRVAEGISPFTTLLREVLKLDGLERLSMMTPHPKDLNQDLIDLFASSPILMPRLHLPLQSGSNAVLSRMSRKYTSEHFLGLVAALRKARPHLAISTDLIVGFPGETEEDFLQTLACMEEAQFMTSFSFYYSDRPNTAASSFAEKIPHEVQHERLLRLQALQEQLAAKWLQSCIGCESMLILQGMSKRPLELTTKESWKGRDMWGNIVHVLLPENFGYVGKLVPVRMTGAKRNSLIAIYKEEGLCNA